MRYAPPGLCVNDFALLCDDDGSYAVLHLQGPWTNEFDHLRMETSYGRATSTDLVDWHPQGSAFGTGLPGRFDQQAAWTMHPIRHGAGMAMLYTGVSGLTPGGWPLQSVGLAYSDRTDGTGWRRHGTAPVVEADARWYLTGERMGWRDPFVVRDDESDGWVMVLCAQDASLPLEVSGCVALATSHDLEHWTVHPPLLSPGDVDELECPVLEQLDDGSWLLLGSIGATRGFDAWTAPRLRGPWTRHGPLGPTGAYAPRIVAAPDGSRVVLHTTPRRVGLTDTGAHCRGMLAQPKLLSTPPGEAPRLEWWPGLDAWLDDPADTPALHAVGDVDVSAATTSTPVDITLRADADGPALTVHHDGTRLRITGPSEAPLGETTLAEPPAS
ncbi:mucin-1, partial [Streptomyces sp. OF3]